jgi:hypothetical protein
VAAAQHQAWAAAQSLFRQIQLFVKPQRPLERFLLLVALAVWVAMVSALQEALQALVVVVVAAVVVA